jgi:2-polyprenyl-3-methyl-5-hydroxy-6-metoxy-1,4-benzoquinol methylase
LRHDEDQLEKKMLLPSEFSGAERNRARNEERHRHIIDANSDALSGKRVLDLACFNGRWSFAALQAGATFVTGVEGRAASVEAGRALFKKHGVENKSELICSDMFDYLFSAKPGSFDTILCLGVYYHIMDHYALLRLMTRLKPQTIIIDSGFVRSFRNFVFVHSEQPSLNKNALPQFAGQKSEVIGQVSLGLMIQMAWNLGYNCRPIVWARKDIAEVQPVKDYMAGTRYTLRLEPMTGHTDPEMKPLWSTALKALNPAFVGLLDMTTHDAKMDKRCRGAGEFSVLTA